MAQIVLKILYFYIGLVVLLGVYGVSTLDEELTFPEKPDFGTLGDIPIIGDIVEGGAFIILALVSVFDIVFLSFTDLLPAWLNTIIFLPVVIYLLYEASARLIRGS